VSVGRPFIGILRLALADVSENLRPGERIRLIKEARASFSLRPTSEMELILQEFGVPTYNRDGEWESPDDETYCTSQLQQADDSVLVAVHEFLQGEDAAPSTRPTLDGDSLWGSQPARAFLSHVYGHRDFVGTVKLSLASFGISGFVAHDDISPSHDWRNSIKAALATCDVFVAFLDEGFHSSQWCDQEVGWALSRGVPILPIRPEGFDRTKARDGFLEESQDICLDQASGPSKARWTADRIFVSLFSHTQTREVGVKALAEAFVHSRSYDQTRRLWDLIKRQPLIEGPQLRRLEYAVSSNNQVYEAVANGGGQLPGLVNALVRKFEPPSYEEPF